MYHESKNTPRSCDGQLSTLHGVRRRGVERRRAWPCLRWPPLRLLPDDRHRVGGRRWLARAHRLRELVDARRRARLPLLHRAHRGADGVEALAEVGVQLGKPLVERAVQVADRRRVHQPKLPNHESRRLITKMVCSASRHASQCVATTMYSARRKIEIVASVSEIRVRQRLTRRDERTRRTSLSKRVVRMILTILILSLIHISEPTRP